MPDDPVREYLTANHHLVESTKSLARLIELIGNMHRYLFNTATNRPNPDGFPRFEACAWPSALDIKTALTRYEEARSSVEEAWQRVEHEDRGVLIPPQVRAGTPLVRGEYAENASEVPQPLAIAE